MDKKMMICNQAEPCPFQGDNDHCGKHNEDSRCKDVCYHNKKSRKCIPYVEPSSLAHTKTLIPVVCGKGVKQDCPCDQFEDSELEGICKHLVAPQPEPSMPLREQFEDALHYYGCNPEDCLLDKLEAIVKAHLRAMAGGER